MENKVNIKVEKPTKVELDKLINHLKEKWGESCKCPYCKGQEWAVESNIFELVQLKTHKPEYHEYQPLVTVSCKNCGNTVLLNTMMPCLIESIDKASNDNLKEVRDNA